jgi:RHS repeat-associated protein
MVDALDAELDDFGGGSVGGSSFSGISDPKETPKQSLIPVSEWLKTHKGEPVGRKGMARQARLKNPGFIFRPLEITSGEVITITYGYDDLYRLTAADYSDGSYFSYSYDPVGNRLTEQTQSGSTSYAYDIADRLTSVNGVSYTWDNNGSLLNDGVRSYTYDAAQRLVAASSPYGNTSFSYNGDGVRVGMTVNGVTTAFTPDVNSPLPVVLEGHGTATTRYLYGLDLIAERTNAEWLYYHADGLGSTRSLTDGLGEMAGAYLYAPFGSPLVADGPSVDFRFTGEQADDPTGLYYLRARYYDPSIGRFTQPDPFMGMLTMPLAQNPYAYTVNNPVRYTDPMGLNIHGLDTASFIISTPPLMKLSFMSNLHVCNGNFQVSNGDETDGGCKIVYLVVGGTTMLLGGFVTSVGLFAMVASVGEDATFVGFPLGLHTLAIGGLTAGIGVGILVLGGYIIWKSGCIPDLSP